MIFENPDGTFEICRQHLRRLHPRRLHLRALLLRITARFARRCDAACVGSGG